MSLAITLANQYGIVMSADRRITTAVTRSETNETESFVLTEHEQKLFLTKAGHGISYTGASSLAGGRRTACIIRKTLAQLEECLSLEDEILSVKKELQAFANGRNVILIGAAICDEKNRVLSSSLTTDESIDYLRFLTRSVAGLQHYAQMNQTVSEACDVLVIQSSGTEWITSPEVLY